MTDRKFVVVEQAGYIGERDIISYPTLREAMKHIDRKYDSDERDRESPNCLNVDIRQDWTDAEGEHQEYVY